MIGRVAAEPGPQPPATVAGRSAASGFVVSFEPAVHRVGHMRRITAAHLRHHGPAVAPLIDDAVLVVSEPVANAIQHGKGKVGLKVTVLAGELRIEVSDGNTTPARPRAADDDAEDGRGPLPVAALTRTWGVSEDGTTTWCTLVLPDGRL
ncbi:ATP-binding protein [Streptomyces sp. MRC013]|uniref:ATP-binding protein n=1 Tax=Streptomyces sp. MRC013 TaxID=2898276 RepID=UPI00202740B2|nr:ATP-binding protein [Streptomyces sp. MRC013]URM91105.1 ATP-binding protein [Streptomyces sp. MRC013]